MKRKGTRTYQVIGGMLACLNIQGKLLGLEVTMGAKSSPRLTSKSGYFLLNRGEGTNDGINVLIGLLRSNFEKIE